MSKWQAMSHMFIGAFERLNQRACKPFVKQEVGQVRSAGLLLYGLRPHTLCDQTNMDFSMREGCDNDFKGKTCTVYCEL